MLQTLSIPTWFLTLSAADLHWPEMIKAYQILREVSIWLKYQLNVYSDMGGSSSIPYHFTDDLFLTFPNKKYVKTDQYEHRYRPV